MTAEDKPKGSQSHPQPAPPQPYGTFQGVPTYPPPHPPTAIGFPHPVAPPGATADPSAPPPPPDYYARGYQAVPGYAVAEGRPVNEHRLPCCGLGFGWFLFILGFFTVAIPWYIGVVLLICTRHRMDYREKPGYVACTIAAILATIAIIFGATKGADD